jgi:L,D-peptidoglycan transpeptidase YkuD (ErfK/YbiS/YcfS/YnhG family)
MRKSIVVAAAAALLAAAGVVVTQHAFAATTPAYHPTRLKNVGDARQLIVVVGSGPKSTTSRVYTYQRGATGTWTAKFPPMAGRNGYAGWVWAASRVQNTGTTPAGTFRITTGFGLKANPGTTLSYRKVDANDYWVGDNKDAKTYNLFQPSASAKRTWRTSQAEKLSAYPTQYEYAAVIDFNRPAAGTVTYSATLGEYVTSKPVSVKRGSAIFLHINGKGSTAGCVSITRANMINVLRWLNPAMKPRIVMAPAADIGRA